MFQSAQVAVMAKDDSAYRLGKLGWAVVIVSGIVGFFGGLSNGSMAMAITSFASGSISVLIVLSFFKFVFVAGKRTLLQQNDEEVEPAS